MFKLRKNNVEKFPTDSDRYKESLLARRKKEDYIVPLIMVAIWFLGVVTLVMGAAYGLTWCVYTLLDALL